MEVNIGDKVRFLNAVGGGVVKGFQKGGYVLVEDENGFDIPVRQNEIVVVPADNYSQDYMQKLEGQTPGKSTPSKAAARMAAKTVKEQQFATVGEALSASSASRQTMEEVAGAGDADAQPASVREEELEKRILQLEMTVSRLTMRIERLENAHQQREAQKKQNQLQREEQKRGNSVRGGQPEIIEVDLHASELLESTAGLSAADIKNYQLKVFRETMEANKGRKGQRIVFIHGNGEGVLRKAIVDELRHSYKSCEYQDASFLQYGFGATMVIVH